MDGYPSLKAMEAEVRGRCSATMASMRRRVRSSCSLVRVRMSPVATADSGITLVFPKARPPEAAASNSTSVPPRTTPTL